MLEILDWRALIRLFFLFVILCFVIKSYKKGQWLLVFAFMLVFLGGLSNNIVTFANGNKMPGAVSDFELAYRHAEITKDTKFLFLGDIFNVYILIHVFNNQLMEIGLMFSIGDIISFLGAIFLVICLFVYPVEKKLQKTAKI